MKDLIPIVGILAAIALPIATVLVLAYKSIIAQHKERMGMIEQGIIPPEKSQTQRMPNRYNALRNGVVLAALGIGVLVGFVCAHNLDIADNDEFWIIASSIVFFLGVGYLVFFALTKNMKVEEEPRQE